MKSGRILFVVLLFAALAGGLAWFALEGDAAPATASVDSETRASTQLAVDAPLSPLSAIAETDELVADPNRVAACFSGSLRLRVRVYDVGADADVTTGVFIELTEPGRPPRHQFVEDAGELTFDDVSRQRVHLTVLANGYDNFDQAYELAAVQGSETSVLVELRAQEQVAFRVRTSRGHSYAELAVEAGIPVHELFGFAFDVAIEPTRGERNFVTHFAPDEPNSADLVGVLYGRKLAGLRVALKYFGQTLDWRTLAEGDREVVYELEFDELRAGFARMPLRVVDAYSKAELGDATARLTPMESEFPRGMTVTARRDGSGRLVAEWLAPGKYELLVAAPGYAEYSETFEFSRGVSLVPNAIELEPAQPLRVRVIDGAGRPLSARVQVGLFVSGKNADDLLPKHFATTDFAGIATIGVPNKPAIVRAIAVIPLSATLPAAEVKSALALIDPTQLPAQLDLVIAEPTLVEIVVTPGAKVGSLRLDDASEVVLRRSTGPALLTYAQPGRYTALAFDAHDRELARSDFVVVEGERVALTLP